MKVPLQYEESIEIRHDVVRFLFPRLHDQDLHSAGLSTYVERTWNSTWKQRAVNEFSAPGVK